MKIFINSPLSTLAEQKQNEEIRQLAKQLGYDTYLPQEHIPPGSSVSSIDVLNANIRAVREAEVILTIFDKPGLGVAFEVGYALALGKKIIGFRTDVQDYLGKVLEGLWENLLPSAKATNIGELRSALTATLLTVESKP